MRKDELKSGDFCPDCMEADDGNAESDVNNSEECCCCCCSCSDSASENESSNVSTAENQPLLTLEQRKKELLSNLSIRRTNREPVSVEQVLQFVEALTHSSDFLRRYNLQEDFCLECLLSEPTCTCCVNGVSQLDINDESCDSCEECNGSRDPRGQRYSSQDCSNCTSTSKTSNSTRLRSSNRRQRRRRRRQSYIDHNLPRIATHGLIPSNIPPRDSSNRDSLGKTDSPNLEQHHFEDVHHGDNCDQCVREEISRRRNRREIRSFPDAFRDHPNEESEYCEECARGNSPYPSCSYSSCGDSETKSQAFGSCSSCEPTDRGEKASCDCCDISSNEVPKNKLKKPKKSNKPESDQNERSFEKNLSANCSCEECQSTSECSDESCDECCSKDSKQRKRK